MRTQTQGYACGSTLGYSPAPLRGSKPLCERIAAPCNKSKLIQAAAILTAPTSLCYDRGLLSAMQNLIIPVTKLRPDARLPETSHGPAEDAGLDLFAVEDVLLAAGAWESVPTGLAIEIPAGFEGQVRPRSGLARKFGVTLLNSPGTIDPGYRGEVQVLMINHGKQEYQVRKGDRIAQLILGAYAAVEWSVKEQLGPSRRAAGGFGSTGT
jgi:dUTP pyrophosphatase